jgi:hypothetical protein
MSIKKLSIFLFSFFLTLEVSANVKIEKKFKLWESQYVESAEGKVCFAVSMPTKMSTVQFEPGRESNFCYL